jgi:hypothetical protein
VTQVKQVVCNWWVGRTGYGTDLNFGLFIIYRLMTVYAENDKLV